MSFGVYLMVGLVPYTAFQEGLARAAAVFRANVALVQRIRIPLEVLVISEVLGILAHKVIALALVLIVCGFVGSIAPASLGWTVMGLLLLLLWTVGLALIMSVAGAFLPDAAEILAIGLQLLFYMTPIVYPMSMIQGTALGKLVGLNPMTIMIQAVRAGLLGSRPPGLGVVGLCGAVGLVLLASGAAAIDHWRLRIPDVL